MTNVGRFTFDPTTNEISGPADYMNSESFSRRMKDINTGIDPVFNMNPSPDMGLKVLVSLQTDYAAFQGMKEMMSWG